MRALTVTPDARFVVSEIADPSIADNEVLVRVSACGICGSDLHMMESKIVPAGAIMGHEASGVVESVGDAVDGFATGDHVAIQPFDPCGTCPQCISGSSQRCANNAITTIGLGFRPGAYAELISVTPQMLVQIPSGVPLDLAAVSEPLAVAYHGFRRSHFGKGMSVGVIGCGPIGLSAIACAKALGASRVWASDPNEFRCGLARDMGADEAGRSPKDADIVFDCAGAKGTIDLAVSSASGGGQVVVLAINISGDNVYPFIWVTKEVDIIPSLGYTIDEYAACARMISGGDVDVAPMITKRVSLDEMDEAFFGLLAGAPEGKVLVTP